MDTSSVVAAWAYFVVTAVGLGGLISQANAINDKMDPFHANRTVEYLGIWFHKQRQFPWYVIAKPPPVGPAMKASLSEGFCGLNNLYLTRVPIAKSGKAGWSVLLSIFHVEPPRMRKAHSDDDAENGSVALNRISGAVAESSSSLAANETEWYSLPQQPLVRHQKNACTVISRTTLMAVMAITNARKAFQYSGAAGFRAGYASYNGQWYITWPIGQEATVQFAPHDSHSLATDVYPPSFPQQVHRCVQMMAGVVSAREAGLQVAFCGRKPSGTYELKHIPNGFPGAHGSRHLYNMMGGKVYEVDFFAAKAYNHEGRKDLVLQLPSTEHDGEVRMVVRTHEEDILKRTLDCLPWSSLSWSVHRGMRDILVTYAKPVMDQYRQELAKLLKDFVAEKPWLLDARGWHPQFVRHSMGSMAVSAILAGTGNSGDLVRVVSDIVLALVDGWDQARLDQVTFWRRPISERSLDLDGIVALTKLFVLEWSNEFDYQLYHDLPISLYFI